MYINFSFYFIYRFSILGLSLDLLSFAYDKNPKSNSSYKPYYSVTFIISSFLIL